MSFHFRPLLTVFAALGLAALVGLGLWQIERGKEKRALIERIEARLGAAPIAFDEALARAAAGEDMEYAPVFAAGVYAYDLEAQVFGTHEGAIGAFVFTPLDMAAPGGGRRFLYVNRGFVPQALRAREARRGGEPEGELRVEGLLRAAERPRGLARLLLPADQPADNLWFVRDPVSLAAHHAIAAAPFYIDSNGRENPGAWPKGGVTRIAFPNRHTEYALTWFGLAGALAAVYLAFSLRRG